MKQGYISMIKKITILFVLIFTFSQRAFCNACFDSTAGESMSKILSIMQFRNVWPGFEHSRLVLFISDVNAKNTIVLGATEDELKKSSLKYEACEMQGQVDKGYNIKEPIAAPKNGVYDIRLLSQPGADAIGVFAVSISSPIIQIKIPNDYKLNDEVMSRVLIHEGFHGLYQFSANGFKRENPQPRDFLAGCLLKNDWKNALIAQSQILAASLKETDQIKLKANWQAILQLRNNLKNNSETKFCIEAQNFWERIEGTAHFVETEAAYLQGILAIDGLQQELSDKLLQDTTSDSFFYYTGDAFLRLVRANGISDWNSKIDQGMMIDELYN